MKKIFFGIQNIKDKLCRESFTLYCILKARVYNNSTQNSSQSCACIYACSFRTSSKWEIWQLAPHHEYNVLFLIVLGAATQHFTRGGFATSCLHFSAPFEVVQTHRPNPRSNVLFFLADKKGVPFLSSPHHPPPPPPYIQTIS